MKKSELRQIIREEISILKEDRTPQEIFNDGKDLAKQFLDIVAKLQDNKAEYMAAVKESVSLDTIKDAADKLYGKKAYIAIKPKEGNVKISFNKSDDYIRPKDVSEIKKSIEQEIGKPGSINVRYDVINSHNEIKNMSVSFTAQYLKSEKSIVTWGNGWNLRNVNKIL